MALTELMVIFTWVVLILEMNQNSTQYNCCVLTLKDMKVS